MLTSVVPSSTVMRFSFIACVAVIMISLFSKGLIGGLLYKMAVPILAHVFANMPVDIAARQDSWVSSALMLIPIIWALGFLVAGSVYQKLESLNWTNLTVKTAYIVIVIAWNLLIWFGLIMVVAPLS